MLGPSSTIRELLILLFLFVSTSSLSQNGILYPQESETREVKSLDGIWNFRIAPRLDPDAGFREEWYSRPLYSSGDTILMPVPSSYNDLTQSTEIRDHVGWAWYDREFRIPRGWTGNRVFIRFGGVNYHAVVWINGIQIVEHSGGHLPILAEIDPLLLYPTSFNRITVAVNNTLTGDTVPQGKVTFNNAERFPKGYFTLDYNFDFFNYAGIHRPVFLYTTPKSYIDDIDVHTDIIDGTTGIVDYSVSIKSTLKESSESVSVCLQNKEGICIVHNTGASGKLTIENAHFWWPYTMVESDSETGYLYTLIVKFSNEQGSMIDTYRLKVGIRTIDWTETSFFINKRPFYFRGFGRHEDYNIRGKGVDNVMMVKDHNLIKWMGANSYRTSHYPYAEEIMDLADELGIVIIDECPAVSLDGFGSVLLENHKKSIGEMIQRDKNRASVVMWSVGNEPQSQKTEADPYFKAIVDFTKSLDAQRPLTLVTNQGYYNDLTVKYMDIISINRYYSWYSDTGHLEVIDKSMRLDVQNWVNKFHKPLIVAEYGADTISGMHSSPEFVFTEDYQLSLLKEHFKAFDFLRGNTSLIGEMIWNFADFMTKQGITRIGGNKKGIFTRERQPKASAHYMRLRYFLLAEADEKYPAPEDIKDFVPIYGYSPATSVNIPQYTTI